MKYLVCLFILGVGAILGAQPESGLLFLSLPQAGWTNPALSTPGWQIALPSFSIGFNQPSINLSEALSRAGRRRILEVDKLQLQSGGRGYLTGQIKAESFLMSRRKEAWSWTFGLITQGYWAVDYPQDVLGLLLKGNAVYAGKSIDLGHRAEGSAWHKWSVGLGYHRPVLNLAMRLNHYVGLYQIRSQNAQSTFKTDALGYQIDLQTDILYQVAGQWGYYNSSSASWVSKWQGTGGSGWGLDAGLQAKLGNKWVAFGSIINAGWINWNKHGQQLALNRRWTLTGSEIIPPFDQRVLFAPDFEDSLEQAQIITKPIRYKTSPPAELNFCLHYQITERWKAGGALSHTLNSLLSPNVKSLRIAYRKDPGFETGVTLNHYSLNGWQIGWQGVLWFRQWQIFALTDQLLQFLPAQAWRGFHFRMGAALRLPAPVNSPL